jgi:GNAT superfamily N-acetyltransferase
VSPAVTIRPVRPADVPAVVAMVHELADFEQAADECLLTPDQLHDSLFAGSPAVFGHVAVLDDEPVGVALWFLTYSTWTGVHGIHLEDLYVRPAARLGGAGRALIAELARICAERGYQRLEWQMLDWNPAAGFYASLGAQGVPGWLRYRVSGPALGELAERASAETG